MSSRRCDKCQWDEVFVCVCDEDTDLLFLLDTFLLRLFLSPAEMLADGECWRGGSLPCAHTVARSRPSSKRPQVGCLGHKLDALFQQRLTFHTHTDYSDINLWFGVTFLGQIRFCGASREPVRCPKKVVFNSLFPKKTLKSGWNCGSAPVWNILSRLNL